MNDDAMEAMTMMDVTLLGTMGMMPMPGRYLASGYVKVEGHAVLIDCGEATQLALRSAGASAVDIDVVCISHFHGDHVLGLPGMFLLMGNSGRTEKVTVAGPGGVAGFVSSLLVAAPHLPFDIEFVDLAELVENTVVNDDGTYDVCKLGPAMIQAFAADHTVESYGYNVVLPRAGKFDVSRAEALGLPKKDWGMLQHGETIELADGTCVTPDMVLGAPRRGLKFSYVTDTRPTTAIEHAVAGADLLVCEGMYGSDEKREHARKKKHMLFSEAGRLARAAKASKMWLTHYSPSESDPKGNLCFAKDEFPATECGHDGKSMVLRFQD